MVALIWGMATTDGAGSRTASTRYTVLLHTVKLPRMLALFPGYSPVTTAWNM